MSHTSGSQAANDHLSPRDFDRLTRYIHEHSGIVITTAKQTMLEGRLRKRVKATSTETLRQYCKMIFDDGGLDAEAIHLIDVVTTNKTEFFREPEHFRILTETVIPSILDARKTHQRRPVKLWSTACSIGAEPYTLAIVLAEYARVNAALAFEIIGTDISTRVLQTSARATYPESMIEPIPIPLRKRYLLRGKGPSEGLVRMAPALRGAVRFGRLNLMDESYPIDRDQDVVFCRNMLIYFDRPTQLSILARLCQHLRPDGYLFLGHSESIAGFDLPLQTVGPTVFRRT